LLIVGIKEIRERYSELIMKIENIGQELIIIICAKVLPNVLPKYLGKNFSYN
jgi:hypothetical protein